MIKYVYIRKAIVTCFISVALISIGSAISAQVALEKYLSLESALSPMDTTQASKTEGCFYIKEHEDIIGVFNSEGELLYTVNVYTKMLPASDRALLRNGIAARDREELYEILGDYNS